VTGGLCSRLLLTIGSSGQAPSKVTSQLKNELGMEFVRITQGEFMMGCSEGDSLCDADESPRHRVQITKDFETGKFEVTQAQWMALMHDNPSSQQGSNLPISKLDAQSSSRSSIICMMGIVTACRPRPNGSTPHAPDRIQQLPGSSTRSPGTRRIQKTGRTRWV